MATITGLVLSSIFKRNGVSPAPRDLPEEVILPNSLMSAPATKVRPPPIRTAALTLSSSEMRSSASETPSGTPGLSALTGGLLMVMMAMSLSFVSCTKSVIDDLWFDSLRGFGGDVAGVNHSRGDAFAMKRGVSECRFRCFRSAVVQVQIVFPREPHAAVNLDATVADCAGGIAGIHLGNGNGSRCIGSFFFQRPARVVHCGTGTLGFQIHIGALVLDCLKRTNRFAELFPSFGVFDSNLEGSLHTAD